LRRPPSYIGLSCQILSHESKHKTQIEADVKRWFLQHDSDGNGHMDVSELREVFYNMDIRLTHKRGSIYDQKKFHCIIFFSLSESAVSGCLFVIRKSSNFMISQLLSQSEAVFHTRFQNSRLLYLQIINLSGGSWCGNTFFKVVVYLQQNKKRRIPRVKNVMLKL